MALPKHSTTGVIESGQPQANLSFTDCHCALGTWTVPGWRVFERAGDLLAEMDARGIAEALVHHATAKECDMDAGNAEILRQVAGAERLHAAVVVAPQDLGGSSEASRIGALVHEGAKAAWMFPGLHRFAFKPWMIEGIAQHLAHHRLPLFVDFGNKHWMDRLTDWAGVDQVCSAFPEIPIVLVREGLGSTRMLLSLMERHANFHLELSYFQPNDGVGELARRFGAQHLLFGSGMPVYDPGPPMSLVAYAGLDRAGRQLVAGDNLNTLLKRVKA